jgi:hypothetical protein
MKSTKRSRRIVVLAVTAIAIAFVQLGNGRIESPDASARERIFTATHVFGLVPEQRARFCVGTLSSRGPKLDWSILISDNRGAVLLQSPETHSPAGEWRCVDVPRSSIAIAGEPTTGRVQVAARHIVKAPPGTQPSQIVGSFEIVNGDGGTGPIIDVLYSAAGNSADY